MRNDFKKSIGVDVGGSHVSASLIDLHAANELWLHINQKVLDSKGSANTILQTIGACIIELITGANEIDAIGIAFPGPFDYEKGVSAITGVGGKFQSTFGIHVGQALKNITGCHNTLFCFSNDAHCFAVGANYKYKPPGKRKIFLTLGTGFGSAFIENDSLLVSHPDIPLSGAFYDQPFLDAIADEYFSTRWLLNEYKQRTGQEISSVKELAALNTEIALTIFEIFGAKLGEFLLPWLKKFDASSLVIGGNISRANSLFGFSLDKQLEKTASQIDIIYCSDTEECILTGAAIIAGVKNKQAPTDISVVSKRKTSQALLPVTTNDTGCNGYDIYPSFHSGNKVRKGFNSLAEKIVNEKIIIIDGFGGVQWENFREQLNNALFEKNKKAFWYDINTCLKTPVEIDEMIKENLNGDDPVFGKKYTGSLADFFDTQKLSLLYKDASVDLCIVYGTGASLSNWEGLLVYLDVPKNEIQYRMRAGCATNIGSNKEQSNSQTYKRLYFVDWPVLNKYKEQLLQKIDCIVDEQRIYEITWMEGEAFRNSLSQILEQPFRARPWFEAGIWGGDWMKKHFPQLNQDEINYAWSFELITPENGIVIEGENNLLEVSFDYLLFFDNKKLLGNAAVRFGKEFPIRFDFLDTYNGGNLSIQCHPRTDYIKDKFGENFTQDETYYILDCEPDANVYLGFQEDVDAGELKTALTNAQVNGIEIPIEKYVQKHKTHKHDLFLIPNGTIHASGKNNLVLEMSSTPYIFTFKMYDWQRLDLNGQPRPINIEHAFANLYFNRKGAYVTEKLIAKPVIGKEWKDGRKIKLPTHEEHFYVVDRYEFEGSIQIITNNQCHVCMLVEGETVEVRVNNKNTNFQYAETFVIPAAVGNYELKQQGNKKALVVVAYVKEECC